MWFIPYQCQDSMLQKIWWEGNRFFAPIEAKSLVLIILVKFAIKGDSLTFPHILAYIWSSKAPNRVRLNSLKN